MKKLIVAMLITCAAVLAHGAAAKWTVLNVQSSPSATVGANWMVCIYEGNAANYSYDDALSGALAASDTQMTFENNGKYNAVNTENGFGNFANSSSHTFYAVVYDAESIADAKNYIVSSDLTKTFNDSGSPQTWGFGNMASTTTANKFLNSSWTATAPIPEPTSGLLLVVGGALLALRRKQK